MFTGVPAPEEFDAVVMQEHCMQRGSFVAVSKRPQSGDNIRVLGEDVAAGEVVLSAGTRSDARHIALLAAAGVPATDPTTSTKTAKPRRSNSSAASSENAENVVKPQRVPVIRNSRPVPRRAALERQIACDQRHDDQAGKID
jgi:hypothetical protein